MPMQEYSQALSEAESSIKAHWQQVLKGIEERGSVAYIFEVRGNNLFLMQKAIEHIEPVLEQLHKSKIISKKLYDNAFSDLETLNLHINKIDKGHEDIERWFEEAKQYVTSAVADIQGIKLVIGGEVNRRQSIAAKFRKGARMAASIGAIGAAAFGAAMGTPSTIHAQERPVPGAVTQDSLWQRYQREIMPLSIDPFNNFRYLRRGEYVVRDYILQFINSMDTTMSDSVRLGGLYITTRFPEYLSTNNFGEDFFIIKLKKINPYFS